MNLVLVLVRVVLSALLMTCVNCEVSGADSNCRLSDATRMLLMRALNRLRPHVQERERERALHDGLYREALLRCVSKHANRDSARCNRCIAAPMRCKLLM